MFTRSYFLINMEKPIWLKEKGYLHLSPSLQIGKDYKRIVQIIQNPHFISTYAFYPLIHTNISDRKYKKGNSTKHTTDDRSHTHYDIKTKEPIRNAKVRPLHYASHFDSLVYSYYAYLLNQKYIAKLEEEPLLNQAITAYRKILISKENSSGKSNIHFAKECFDEIKHRALDSEEVMVLAFDLKSFFSTLDHKYLKERWAWLINEPVLPKDHYNVFKSCTNFSYVLLDNLRLTKTKKGGKKRGFDESKLSDIRKKKGYRSFFYDNVDFRNHIKEGKLPVFKNHFYRELNNGKKVQMGIPQGLPISATLANLYLYEFDLTIINNIVKQQGGFYRRYSDDILIMCKPSQEKQIEESVLNLIKSYHIRISEEKTEKFLFKKVIFNKNKDTRLECFKIKNIGDTNKLVPSHLTYLGFEFRGYNVCIKSPNLSKYYRKIVSTIKRRSKRTLRLLEENSNIKTTLYLNQLKKVYNVPIKRPDTELQELRTLKRKRYRLVKHIDGFFHFEHFEVKNKKQANYYSYILRCSSTFGTNSFKRQVRKRKHIAYTAITKHFTSNL
ncbi:hyperthetical protein [Myroides odoratimimus]|nr:hyperthetical protein [Myroides odoratimimus]